MTYKKKPQRDRNKPLKFQLQRRSDIPSYKQFNVPRKFKQISDGKQKTFLGCILIDPTTQTRRIDMIKVIYEKQGYGEYNVLAWDLYRKNKRYSKKHECKGHNCPFYQDMSCRRYTNYKTGQACKDNPIHHPNWRVVARVEIFPSDEDEGWGYAWNKAKDQMSRRYGWFLKG